VAPAGNAVSGRGSSLRRATWGPLAILLVVTVVIPAIVFDQFRRADDEQRALLLLSIKHQGTIMMRSLSPLFEQPMDAALPELALAVARIDPGTARIRVFVRPLASEGGGFFYVATNASLKQWQMATERREIMELGVLSEFQASCQAGQTRTAEYRSEEGAPELITSIVPYRAEDACWVVMLSHNAGEYGAAAVRSSWDSPQVHVALALYITMVIAAAALVASVLMGVKRMERAARSLREGGGEARFDDEGQLPQFAAMARELDSLVASLRSSSDELRRAAEDNAHALKTPVITIRHAVESLQGQMTDPAARDTLSLVLRATDRLAEMVQSIRRLDVAAADAMLPNRRTLDLSSLLAALAQDYGATARAAGVTMECAVAPGLTVSGDADLLETVFENVLDNALSFAPKGSLVVLSGEREGDVVAITVEDEGPGVDPAMIERIFDRHVSVRPDTGDAHDGHFGIGLWICRRHVGAHGGSIAAENRATSGLRIRVRLPAA